MSTPEHRQAVRLMWLASKRVEALRLGQDDEARRLLDRIHALVAGYGDVPEEYVEACRRWAEVEAHGARTPCAVAHRRALGATALELGKVGRRRARR
jgi:hypothetical protein